MDGKTEKSSQIVQSKPKVAIPEKNVVSLQKKSVSPDLRSPVEPTQNLGQEKEEIVQEPINVQANQTSQVSTAILEEVLEKKRSVNTTIILLFIIVFLLGIVIGYFLSGPQFNPVFDSSKVPFIN